MMVTIGNPAAAASDQPRKTYAMVLPRFSTGTIKLTVPAACGVKGAATAIITSRIAINVA